MANEHPFVDPVSGRQVVLHFGDAPGVEHPGCLYRTEVSPELDCFFCRQCSWNGRISGAWFMELLVASQLEDLSDEDLWGELVRRAAAVTADDPEREGR